MKKSRKDFTDLAASLPPLDETVMAVNLCRNCDAPATRYDACDECYRDPEKNDCTECGCHLEGICYPYVCGSCIRGDAK